ncbi:MAG: DUF3089 domain-containing protein [Runella slithyformis]|nr:MAG: DUF3089 domain-containing protein [Runella slithyformis]TAF93336.1 MAG: DUF3089 domain-containing protein [Runella sp.]TAG24045.1 MAG: DUF3089 domain-containing protein [Cytophagales bacterium]TAG34818.1 MAG: DUF3089 domain-containing protein [Cytophagia bacterium]TAE99055.1 MAG: DUF3089 domain-containing protein [Runella slithyformis]
MRFKKVAILAVLALIWASCRKPPVVLMSAPNVQQAPAKPDYSKPENWAALPSKQDLADSVPLNSNLRNEQATAIADVFFVHPTIYTYQPSPDKYEWNADVKDAELNQKTDNSTILNQATVFNGSCRVYAPRYRQAHYYTFTTQNTTHRQSTLDLAYADVKAAFTYYLEHYHQDRPIFIAAHSQGTLHAKRLLKDFFDGQPLQKKLVFAYLIGDIAGVPVQPSEFAHIKPATTPESVGGFAAWHTYARGFFPDKYELKKFKTSVCTNPLTWKLDQEYAPRELNKGGVALKFKMKPALVDAQVHQGLLWINRPHIAGSALIKTKVWHVADVNFFWQNMRENVALRLETYSKINGQ